MSRARRKGDKAPDLVKTALWQPPALRGVEQCRRRARQRGRTIRAGTEMNRTGPVVAQIQL